MTLARSLEQEEREREERRTHATEGVFGRVNRIHEAEELRVQSLDVLLGARHGAARRDLRQFKYACMQTRQGPVQLGDPLVVEEFLRRQQTPLRVVVQLSVIARVVSSSSFGSERLLSDLSSLGRFPFRDGEPVRFIVVVVRDQQGGVVDVELDDGVTRRVGFVQGEFGGRCVPDQVGFEPVVRREDARG